MTDKTLYPVKLISKIQEYQDIYTFRFEKHPAISHKAGQHCTLHLTDDGEDKDLRRPLTLANAPHEDFLQWTMHTKSQSLFKSKILELEPGDTAWLSHVRGVFFLEEEQSALFIAGGIGFTPFRSMVLDEHHKQSSRDIDVIHVHDNGYIFQEELEALPYEQQYITFTALSDVLNETYLDQFETIYISGSKRFIDGVKDILKDQKTEHLNIKLDTFVGYDEL